MGISMSASVVLEEEVRQPSFSASQQMNWGNASTYSDVNTSDYNVTDSNDTKEGTDEGPGKLLLYFHGNGEDIGSCYFLMSCFKRRLGCRILAMEYPGYGLYGYASKDSNQLLQDALTVFDYSVNVLKVRE